MIISWKVDSPIALRIVEMDPEQCRTRIAPLQPLQLSTAGRHQATQEAGHRLGHVQHDEARARPGADPRQHERGRDGHVRLLPRREKGADSFDSTAGAAFSACLTRHKKRARAHITSGDVQGLLTRRG